MKAACLSLTLAFVLLSSSNLALADYNTEIGMGLSQTQLANLNIRNSGLEASYYFLPVSTADGPLEQASYIHPGKRVYFQYESVLTSANNTTNTGTDSTNTLGFERALFKTHTSFGGQVSHTSIKTGYASVAVSLFGQFDIVNHIRVRGSYGYKGINLGAGETGIYDTWTSRLSLKKLQHLGNNQSFVVRGEYQKETIDFKPEYAINIVTYTLEAGYYFSRFTGFTAQAVTTNDNKYGKLSETFLLSASHFFSERHRLKAMLSSTRALDSILDSKSITLEWGMRF